VCARGRSIVLPSILLPSSLQHLANTTAQQRSLRREVDQRFDVFSSFLLTFPPTHATVGSPRAFIPSTFLASPWFHVSSIC
jgi:hypothetical protein